MLEVLCVRPTNKGKFNPFKASPNEVLLTELYQNHMEILIQEMEQMSREDLVMEVMQQEIDFHTTYGNHQLCHTTRNHDFFDREFWSKKPPIWFFCPHVQFDQSAILEKSIWIQLFWLGFFGRFIYLVIWQGFFY